MTENERLAFNRGLEVARGLVERTASATRRELPHPDVAEMISDTLTTLADGLTMLQLPHLGAHRHSCSALPH